MLATNNQEVLGKIGQGANQEYFIAALLYEHIQITSGGGQSDGSSTALLNRERFPKTELLYSISRLSSYEISIIIRKINFQNYFNYTDESPKPYHPIEYVFYSKCTVYRYGARTVYQRR